MDAVCKDCKEHYLYCKKTDCKRMKKYKDL
jgi:hypothetical protein